MKNASTMKIAPIDIAHKTFSRKVMGLDADEVSDFLRDIADQMEELVRERNALKETVRQKDLQIMEFRERDDSLKATIATATKMSEQIRQDSEREAKLIVNDAHQKGEMILKDSRDSLKRIYTEIADLKRSRLQFEVNLRSLCGAHLSMLEQSHMLMPEPQGFNQAPSHGGQPQHQNFQNQMTQTSGGAQPAGMSYTSFSNHNPNQNTGQTQHQKTQAAPGSMSPLPMQGSVNQMGRMPAGKA